MSLLDMMIAGFTDPHPKPDPDLGWSMLNEYAAKVPEGQRGIFTAHCRDAESTFTSGFISVDQYRSILDKEFASAGGV